MSNDTKILILNPNLNILQEIPLNNLQANLSFLTEFFEQNSTNKSKSIKKSVENKKCLICDDDAIGYNYDVLSCACCKVFFHRNANQDLNKLRCSSNNDKCSISHQIRRKCKKCRLRKCFSFGMKKTLLLTEEEKQRRKSSIEQRKSLQMNLNLYSKSDYLLTNIETKEFLSIEDNLIIENICSLFLLNFPTDLTDDYHEKLTDRLSAIIFWSQLVEKGILDLIKYFRQIDQFEKLNNEDRFIIIKYNLSIIYPILKSFYYNPNNGLFQSEDIDHANRRIRFYQFCFNSQNISNQFQKLISFLFQITENDPIIVSFVLLIVLFSQNLSNEENVPLFKDQLQIFHIQCYYTNILWKYLLNKQGQIQSINTFNRLIRGIFQIQLLNQNFLQIFNSQLIQTNQLAPLMQTVLRIS